MKEPGLGKSPSEKGYQGTGWKATPTLTEDQRTHKLGNALPGTERFLLSLCPGRQAELP
jgi:hypothetical protein